MRKAPSILRHNIEVAYRMKDSTSYENENPLTADLQHQLIRYELAINKGVTGWWDWTDLRQEKIALSDRTIRFLGLSTQNNEVTFTQLYEAVHSKDRVAFLEAFQEHVEEQIPFDLEYRVKTPQGYRWVRTTADSQRDESGQVIRMAGLIQDIQETRFAKTQLEAVNEEMEDFVYSVAHDLRAPVRHISSFIEIMEEDVAEELGEIGMDYLANIRSAADRLGRMIDDLLQVSRNQRLTLRPGRFQMRMLVDRVIQRLLKAEAPDRQLDIEIGDLPELYSDPNLIEQVLRNLLSNAFKYTRSRSVAKIVIDAYEADNFAVIRIQDNGVGFDMAYVDKLFKFFNRLHMDRQYEGTGIGLASVARIMKRLGGASWAEGIPNEGATFYFKLPLTFDAQ